MAKLEYRGKRVLVTGANGLLGSHLVEQLVMSGAEVHAQVLHVDELSYYFRDLNLSNFRAYEIDINNKLALEKLVTSIQPQVIFHLAAETQVRSGYLNPSLTFTTNFSATLDLLESSRLYVRGLERIVVASSDKAYGESPVLPYREDTELRAHGPYDTSKACMDLLCQSYSKTFQIPITIIRAGNIYGPGDVNWDRIIPGVTRWLLQGDQPVLRSTGEMIRDYVYVQDVATAYLLAGAEARSQSPLRVYNVSSNTPINVRNLYEMLCQSIVGKWVEPLVKVSETPEIFEQRLDSNLIRSELGWAPKGDLRRSLESTINWYARILNVRNS